MVRCILDFAAGLEPRLPHREELEPKELLLSDLQANRKAADSLNNKGDLQLSPKSIRDLDRHGRSLWNLCIRLKRGNDDQRENDDEAEILLKARLFAFSILRLARDAAPHSSNTETNLAYLINLAILLGKLCLMDGDTESAMITLQVAADYLLRLQDLPASGQLINSRIRLEAQYLAIRIALVS